jgi:N-methylhydantoinase A
MAKRIGIDVGGTFTDLVSIDDEVGELRVAKVATTPGRPEEGCIAALREAGLDSDLAECGYFLHATTVGLNALLERRGAIVGLLCTSGFRDVLEVRRGDRDKFYDYTWSPPEPLVPRRLRIGVRERVRSNGAIVAPLCEDDISDALSAFQAEGVTSIAVCYLNAYANGVHEKQTEQALRARGFDGAISLSHQISGEYREYERTTTTIIDAFVRARLKGYLTHLDCGLRGSGFKGASLMMRSGGGAMTFDEAQQRPIETIMSGPVAGAQGASDLVRDVGLGDVITADVGGTSFDTCVIVDGRPGVLYEGKVVGLPVQIPWIDVRSIGAGGGSIARVDAGGLLQVGPESAGATPGPACYGRGGVEPTLTDATLFLGMLGTGVISHNFILDRGKAEAALQRVAVPLGQTTARTAQGIVRVAASKMADAIREITVQSGLDPRAFRLLAFGGAGPMMATELARELDIDRVIVPPQAGNFSAWGLLGADLVQSAARTKHLLLREGVLAPANDILVELHDELSLRAARTPDITDSILVGELDMRFVGQEHTVTVAVPVTDRHITASVEDLKRLFDTTYAKTYGITLRGDTEIVAIRAHLRRVLPRRAVGLNATESRDRPPVTADAKATFDAYSFAQRAFVSFRLASRASFLRGQRGTGPLIITEPTATTYVDTDFSFHVDAHDILHLTRVKGAA